MNSDLYLKLHQTIKDAKCKNKDCLSKGNDNLELVWFGKQYEEKIMTCSSCYVMNEEAIKKSMPVSMNVLPVSSFLEKFMTEAKKYDQNRSSNNWPPNVLKNSEKQHMAELQSFENKLNGTLKALALAVEGFTKKVIECNQKIYNNTVFSEIISIYSNNQTEGILTKINLLIKFLNYGEDGLYRFDDLQLRDRKIKKLNEKINEVTLKVLKVLDGLLSDLQEKNSNIIKL